MKVIETKEEEILGAEVFRAVTIVRCRKCGALCVEKTYSSFDLPPWGDEYRTEYMALDDEEEAERKGFFYSGHSYVRKVEKEFGKGECCMERIPVGDDPMRSGSE